MAEREASFPTHRECMQSFRLRAFGTFMKQKPRNALSGRAISNAIFTLKLHAPTVSRAKVRNQWVYAMKPPVGILSAAGLFVAWLLTVASTTPTYAVPPACAVGSCGGGQFHGAPGPIVGAGLPVLAIGFGVYWLVKRRRKA
jgi:hypothetical protein